MAVFTERRQTIHDMMAGTLVTLRRYSPNQIALSPPAPKRSGWIKAAAIVGMILFGPFGIGALGAVAIPAYSDYTLRAQVADSLTMAAPFKAAVAEAAVDASEWEEITTEALNISAPRSSAYVSDIAVVNGAVVIEYSKSTNALSEKSLVLVPGVDAEGAVMWICGYQAVPEGLSMAIEDAAQYTSVAPKFLPPICRP
jgi:type IV pilus assembly protein PilA